jgi:signal transduction histidine kinase
MVIGDAERLSQVVINLLLNAIQAATSARATVGSPGMVRIELSPIGDDRLALAVFDSGPGPSADVRDTMFDPFVTEKPDGVGLGLSVAREIVERHGGRIEWYRSDAMTCFTVELPCTRARPELPADESLVVAGFKA